VQHSVTMLYAKAATCEKLTTVCFVDERQTTQLVTNVLSTEYLMDSDITTNKQGQILGRKGRETRAKLMEATRHLLLTHSPVELTAVGIAAEAGTSPAGFYMYFDDPTDVLYSLGEEAGHDMVMIRKLFDEPWDKDRLEEHTTAVIEALNGVWTRHRQVLRFRNTEASRGDKRFEELRMNTFIPFIQGFAECILSVNPASGTRKRADAYAEASILHGAMEHLAATDPEVTERYLGARRVNSNLARIMTLVIRGESAAEAPKKTSSAIVSKTGSIVKPANADGTKGKKPAAVTTDALASKAAPRPPRAPRRTAASESS
jgi:AcrR family transcriptional regulator